MIRAYADVVLSPQTSQEQNACAPERCGRFGRSIRMRFIGTHLDLLLIPVIGDHVPGSAEEGVRLNVPGIINFTHATGGDNVYIRIA